MAIKLESKNNTVAPNATYPYGNIKDDSGTGNGTPVDTYTYADFHQFFAKMGAESGISFNNLPDNADNGFQLFEMLLAVVGGAWKAGTSSAMVDVVGGGTVSWYSGSAPNNRYRKGRYSLRWDIAGAIDVTGVVTAFTIPWPVSGITLPAGIGAYTTIVERYLGIYNQNYIVRLTPKSNGIRVERLDGSNFPATTNIRLGFGVDIEIG